LKLFDRNGNAVEVPDDQAHAALSSGQFGAPAGTQIPVRVNGQVGSVPVEQLSHALSEGAEVVSQAEYEKADLQARYGDAGHGALAFGTSALDTATLGASNAVIGGLGGKRVRETLRKSEEANPTAAAAGAAAGIIAPIAADVLSGGTATPVVGAAAARAAGKTAIRAGERAAIGAAERAAVESGAARALLRGEEAGELSRAVRPLEGVLEDAPRGLPSAAPEMVGEVVPHGPGLPGAQAPALPTSALARAPIEGAFEATPRALPSGVVDELTGEVVHDLPALRAAPNRALPSVADAEFEAIGTHAAKDTGILAREIGIAPEIRTGAAQATQAAEQSAAVAEAARVAEEARAVGGATEEAAAQASGRGVIRQVVESSLLGPQRLVSGGGQAVEEAVRKIVGAEAESALGRIAQKAVIGAARGAFEGGVYGVGNEVGHQFLQDDPDLNGERLASAWFNGALLGGAFGGGIGAFGQGTKETLAKVIGREGISDHLMKTSGEHMWHAAGPTQKMTAEANRYAGGAWKVGNLIRNDAIEILGRAPGSREELLELAPQIKEKHAGILEQVLNRLDEVSGEGERVKVSEIDRELRSIKNELAARAAPTGQLDSFHKRILDATGALDDLTGKLDPKATVSFSQLRNFRVSVDEMMKFGAAPGTEKAPDVALRRLRGWLEGRVLDAADRVANDAGGTLLKDYKAAKEGYQAGILLEKAAARGKAAEQTNQFFSLTDKLMGIPGAMIGHAAASPVGGFISHFATEHASKFIRKNFDFVVSDALAKLANVAAGEHVLTAAQRSNERVQKRVDQGMNAVRKALDSKDIGERPMLGGPKTFEERRETLLAIAGQHQMVLDHLNSVTKPLDKAAPNVASALMSASLKTVVYLMDALPKPPPPPANSLTPQVDMAKWQPSDQQKAKFNRQYDIATHPEMLLMLVATGSVTADHIAAMQATNPKMLAQAQGKLKKELSTRTKAVPAGMRASTRLVLGVPQVDPSLGRLLQSNYAPPKPAQSGLSKPLKLADTKTLNSSKW